MQLTVVTLSANTVSDLLLAPSAGLSDVLAALRGSGEALGCHAKLYCGTEELTPEKRLQDVGAMDGSLLTLVFSPRLLVASRTRAAIELRAADSGELVKAWPLAEGTPAGAVALSPCGGFFLVAEAGSSKLFSMATGEPVSVLDGAGGAAVCVAVSPEGRRALTASGQGAATIWDVATGERVLALRPSDGRGVFSASASPDGGRFVTLSSAGATLWCAATGRLLHFLGHEDLVLAARFSDDGGELCTFSMGGQVARWSTATGRRVESLHVGDGCGASADGFASASFSPDGSEVFTLSVPGLVQRWSAERGAPPRTVLARGDCNVVSALLSPDGAHLLTLSLVQAEVWSAAESKRLCALEGASRAAIFVPKGLPPR